MVKYLKSFAGHRVQPAVTLDVLVRVMWLERSFNSGSTNQGIAFPISASQPH